MSGFTVVYDACVLCPAPLRDLLMRLALTDLFRATWTDKIHDEWIKSLLNNRPDLTREQLHATRDKMNAHVRDCLVEGYENLVQGLSLPDENDRHVLAAAIKSQASVIVTMNLSDFPAEITRLYGIEPQHPDEVVTHLIDLAPGRVCGVAKQQRAALKNPPKSVEEFLDALARVQLTETSQRLSEFRELI